MFAAACFQFVKSVGKNTLHPVPSIDEKDNVKPFQLVIKSKKRRFIFFEKAVYRPTEFQLTDVMVDSGPMKTTPVSTNFMSEYNRTTSLSLSGQFGADICKEIIDVKLEASDSVELDIKFGKVSKLEIREQELLEELADKNINMDHPFIRQTQEDSKNILCLITGVVVLPDGGTIHRVTEFDTKESVKASVLKGVDESAGSKYHKDRDFGLTPGTAVAYKVHELNVDKDTGAIQLVLGKGSHGGFRSCIGYDEPDAIQGNAPELAYEHKKQLESDLLKPQTVFKPLFDLPESERAKINEWLLQLMSVPRDMHTLSDLMDDVEKGHQIKVNLDDIRRQFVSRDDAWLEILKFVGVQIADDRLDHSEKKTAQLHTLAEFFDAATMLDDNTLVLLRDFPPDMADTMLRVLRDGIYGKPVQEHEVVKHIKGNTTCQKILLDQEFRIQEQVIEAPLELPNTIDAVYWVIYALYGK